MASEKRISIEDGRKPGWYWASNEIIDTYGAEMGPYGLAVYHALCRRANAEAEAWPSYATLAKQTGMTRQQAISTVKRLVELELVSKRLRRDKAGDATSNCYTLLEVGGSQSGLLGGQSGTLGAVNEVDRGSQSGLPKEDSLNNTHLKKKEDTSLYKNGRTEKVEALSVKRGRLHLKDEHGKFVDRSPQEKCLECGQFERQCYCDT